MIIRKSSRVKSTGRNVTPLRAAPPFSSTRTRVFSLRAVTAGVSAGAPASGRRRDRGEGRPTARVSEDCSQDSSSLTLPSGVSSFLLDCLDVDSPTLDDDSTLSSIEEFRKADNYDDASGWRAGDAPEAGVKNSTLLDLSHAQDLALQPAPNLSSITGADGTDVFLSRSPARGPSQTSASGAELRSAQERTPVNSRPVAPYPAVRKCFAEKRKLLKYRKVTFSDIVSVRNLSSHKGVQNERRDQRENWDHPDGSGSSDKPVRFFDFADACEKEAFLHRRKQTHTFTFPAKPIPSST
ncbi:uncharacterized protein LOC120473679 isoform X2 [Pimephales promelas]|uniref:uncharacterized protein LOC120473679 isoform X2 n=1 Tax=Pimephales promelas TaxID=90988 RepID=UPI001955CDD8|nr:uncharacterized protein LOC120473679 isoform X2 [Pimephales promelas]